MKFQLIPLLCTCLALTLSSPALSSEDANFTEFEEITVTATRSERIILDVPAAVSVVTEERLADLPLLGAKEALSGLAGVQSETKNGGYDTRLIIRGSGLKARYGVREIMILLDGVPITDPDGMSRLDFVDTQLIKQIDVVRKLETSTAAVSKWYGRTVKKVVELELIKDEILKGIPSMVAGELPKTVGVWGSSH